MEKMNIITSKKDLEQFLMPRKAASKASKASKPTAKKTKTKVSKAPLKDGDEIKYNIMTTKMLNDFFKKK